MTDKNSTPKPDSSSKRHQDSLIKHGGYSPADSPDSDFLAPQSSTDASASDSGTQPGDDSPADSSGGDSDQGLAE